MAATSCQCANPEISLESSEFVGFILAAILYGVYIVINILSIHALLANSNINRSRRLFYIAFGTLLLMLNTITLAFWALLGQMAWIFHRNDPGPPQYYSNHYYYWYMLVGDATQSAANLLADSLIIYRYYVIFNRKLRYMILPSVPLLSFIVSSIIGQEDVRHWPESKIWKFNGFTIICTIGVNVLVTLMISVRLFLVSRKAYTTVITIMVESAALFTAVGVAASVASLIGSSISEGIIRFWFITGGVSAQLIILRLALGPRKSSKPTKEKQITSSLDNILLTKIKQLEPVNAVNVAAFLEDTHMSVSEWHVASRNMVYTGDEMSAYQMETTPTTKDVVKTYDMEAGPVLEDTDRSSVFTKNNVYVQTDTLAAQTQ